MLVICWLCLDFSQEGDNQLISSLFSACWHDREEGEKLMLCSWSWQVSRNGFETLRLRSLQFLSNRFFSKRAVLWCSPPSSLYSIQQENMRWKVSAGKKMSIDRWADFFPYLMRRSFTGTSEFSLPCKQITKKRTIQATQPIFFFTFVNMWHSRQDGAGENKNCLYFFLPFTDLLPSSHLPLLRHRNSHIWYNSPT